MPRGRTKPTTKENVIERLWSRSTIDPVTGCWLWGGGKDGGGYGYIQFNYHSEKVHRISAHIYLGLDLSSDLHALHKPECPNKNCWFNEHLYVGTETDNALDKRLTGSTYSFHKEKEFCKWGHEYTPENTYIDPSGNRRCKKCGYENKKEQTQIISNIVNQRQLKENE